MILSIVAALPFSPWSGIALAAGLAVVGGLAAGALMNLLLKMFGREGYVAETREQRATRLYMEKAKLGMRDDK
jgi:hypothetical protein